ncbi:MAG: 50S ribosomal protein L24 [Phycisphaerae bacterium]
MAARVRKDDIVLVISGDHRGARGKVLRVIPKDDRVVIEGVNMVYRHMRRNRRQPQGGRVQKEAPIPLSKVMPIDPKTGKPTRVRFQAERDAAGKIVAKRRVSVTGTLLSEVTRGAATRGARTEKR